MGYGSLQLSVGQEKKCFSLDDDPGRPGQESSSCAAGGGLLLTSLLYRRSFSSSAFERAMVIAWAPIWGISMKVLGENLFLFRFEHKIDLNNVLRDGPWRFNHFLLVMKEVTDDTTLVCEILTSIPFWIQVYDVPVLRQTEHVARFVGSLLRSIMAVDFDPGRNRYPYLRIRVEMDIRGALPKSSTLVMNAADKTVKFKYERLFSFCF